MELNWDTFQTKYNEAKDDVKNIIDEHLIGDCVQKIVVGQNLDKKFQGVLIDSLSFHYLEALSEEEIVEQLKNEGLKEPERIISTVKSCISSSKSSKPESEPSNTADSPAVKNDFGSTPVTPIPVQKPVQAPPTQAVPPQPTPPVSHESTGVPKIRTMKDDMSQNQVTPQASPAPMKVPREETYTSTQEAILKEGSLKPKGEVPPPPPPRAV